MSSAFQNALITFKNAWWEAAWLLLKRTSKDCAASWSPPVIPAKERPRAPALLPSESAGPCGCLWGSRHQGQTHLPLTPCKMPLKCLGPRKEVEITWGVGWGVRQGRSGWVISKGDQVQDRIPETGRAVVARKQQTSKATCSRQGTAQDQAPFTPGQEKVLVFPSAFQKRSVATSRYPFPFNCP